jgi:Bacterial archaeo-eukaryotic release factor family 3
MITSTLNATSGILDSHALKFLAGSRGPCITIIVPAHHPGAQEGSRRALVHALVRKAGEEMARSRFGGRVTELLAPLEEIAEESGVDGGGAGFAIFRSPETTARYYLAGNPAEKIAIGDRFYLVPFVADAFAPHEFFVLGLSRKQLRLFRYVNGEAQEMALPAHVPAGLEAAGGFDQPDHNLSTGSYAGPSVGDMRGVHAGTLSDREALPEYVHHFFMLVDRGLKSTLGGKPLLLMGVQEELAAYRKVAKHAYIFTPNWVGNIDFLSPVEVARHAAAAVRAHCDFMAERVLAEYREMPDRSRTLGDAPAVREAAGEGRVHRLCVRSGAEPAPDGEDLINAAIVDTLRAGGEVFVLPHDKMPANEPLAAILRY